MTPQFTGEEIQRPCKKLKNNKSPGQDQINAELIKYGPMEICDEIANIYNITAETGNFTNEIKIGLLNPIPKPNKKRGPPENLRPITYVTTKNTRHMYD